MSSTSNNGEHQPFLSREECFEVSKFENLMEIVTTLLSGEGTITNVEEDGLFYLLRQGLIQYQLDVQNDDVIERDFTLCQCIEAQINRKLLQADQDMISIIRDIVSMLFEAKMDVSETLLNSLNEVEYSDLGNLPDEQPGFDDITAQFEKLASDIDAQSDFDVYIHVSEQLNQLPADAGLLMMTSLFHTKNTLTRDAAVLLLLHPLGKVRESVLEGLTQLAEAGLLNAKDYQRLMSIRSWMNDETKKVVDKVIKQLQRAQVAQQSVVANERKVIHEILLTPADTGGCMGLQVVFKCARNLMLVGCVLKQDFGVKDAFISDEISQSEYRKMQKEMSQVVPIVSITEQLLVTVLSHFLKVSHYKNNSISAELLLLKEYADIDSLQPEEITMERVESIIQTANVKGKADLTVEELVTGWGSPELAGNHQTADELIDCELESNREVWYERLLLTLASFAFTLDKPQILLDVARQIKAGEKLQSIGFFQDIAYEALHVPDFIDGLKDLDVNKLEEFLADGKDILSQLSEEVLGYEDLDYFDDPEIDFEPLKWKISGARPKRAVYQLKISLQGSKPAIWRRVLVMNTIKLSKLHQVIQVSMGWEGDHLYEFTHGKDRFCPPGEYVVSDAYDDNDVQLRDLLYKEKGKLTYTYDFGDSWQHKIVLEKISRAERKNTPVRLIKGVGACPPEDVGGIGGYHQLLHIIKNPRHEEYEDCLEWLGLEEGDNFDPAYFDADEINNYLDECFNR